MLVVDLFAQTLDQRGVIYCQNIPIWCLNVDHQLLRLGVKRSYARWQFLRLRQISGTRGLVRMTKPRPVSQHLALVASGEKRKSFWTGRTAESKDAVAVNSGVAGEHFIQLFAAHAFDRITPKAFHCSDGVHFLALTVGVGRLSG